MPMPHIESDFMDWAESKEECPFADPTYSLDPRIPCPVCGALGGMGDMNGNLVEDLCVDKG